MEIAGRPLIRVLPHAVVAGVLGVGAFAYRYLSFVDFSNDHFVHLSTARQIMLGALPVRDFVERGLPLMSLTSAAAQATFGDGLLAEVILIASAFAATAILTYLAAAALSGSMTVGAATTLVPILVYPVGYSYPKLLTVAVLCMAAFSYCRRPTAGRAALLAAVIAMAFLFRHDYGGIQAVAVVALIAVYHGTAGDAMRALRRVAVVAAIAASPYLLWVQFHEGVVTYVSDGLAFSAREAGRANWWQGWPFDVDSSRPLFARLAHGPVVNVRWQTGTSDEQISQAEVRHGITRHDPNSPMSWQYELSRWSGDDLERLVTDPIVADTHGIDRAAFRLQVPAPGRVMGMLVHVYGPGEGLRLRDNSFAALFYLVWLVPVAAATALALTWRGSTPANRALVAMIVILQLLMNATMLRDPLATRIRDVLVPTALLLSYLMGLIWRIPGGAGPRIARRICVAAALAGVIVCSAAVGEASTQIERMGVGDGIAGVRTRMRTIRRTLAPPDHFTGRRSATYGPLIDYITKCTRADSRLLTMTFAPELFFYTRRGFAGGHVAMTGGYFTDDRNASLVIERLSREHVPLVIMDDETRDEMMQFPRVGEYVQARYHEVGRFPAAVGKSFIVLAENGLRPSTTVTDKALPCFVG
jgi:hypothetical protein